MDWNQFEKEQPIAARLLKNSLVNNRIAHAYLFEGEHGTGKKAGSLLMAASQFCEQIAQGFAPCDVCTNCKRIKSGNHPDVHLVEPDGLSIKIDQIRSLRAEFRRADRKSNKNCFFISGGKKVRAQGAEVFFKVLEKAD